MTMRPSRIRQPPKWLRGTDAPASVPAAAPATAPDSSGEGSGTSAATHAMHMPQQRSHGAAAIPARRPSPASVRAAAPDAATLNASAVNAAAGGAAADVAPPGGTSCSHTPLNGRKRSRAHGAGRGAGNKSDLRSQEDPKIKFGRRAAPCAASAGPQPGPVGRPGAMAHSDPTRFVKRESYSYCHFGRAPDPRTPAQAQADEAAFLQLLQASAAADQEPHAASAAPDACPGQ